MKNSKAQKKGVVVKSTGSWFWVETPENNIYQCRIEGKLRLKGFKSTNPLAVGDEVWIAPENEQQAIIKSIVPRRNYIIRKSVNLARQTQIIAANIDQAVLMATLDFPKTFPRFMDRFLVTAEAYGIPAVLLFNKVDLYSEELLDELEYLSYVYADAGYPVLHTSVKEHLGLTDVKAQLHNKVSLLSGHSGVGKTSLLNYLAPENHRPVKAISEAHGQGQHTTTFAEWFHLPQGGSIIDTPGIKGFGLVDMQPEEIGDYFPEILALKPQCKFSNCMHLQEPDCAVRKAVEEGELAPSRFESYLDFVNHPDDEGEHFRKDIYSE
mgnify:CR=1 FL=1